jgi:hypothetical protein
MYIQLKKGKKKKFKKILVVLGFELWALQLLARQVLIYHLSNALFL